MSGRLAELMEIETEPEEKPRPRIAADEDDDADNPEGNAAWEHLR